MNNNGGFTSKTLREFFNDAEAPPGFIYFIDDEPVVQIDLFEKFYTLFWLGPTSLTTFIESFSHIVSDLKNSSPLIDSILIGPAFEGSVSVVVNQLRRSIDRPEMGTGTPRARYKKELQTIERSDTQTFDTLKNRLNNFVTPFLSDIVSIQSEVKTKFNNRDYEISLWADTQQSKKKNKETGITSNLPITNSLTELLENTCPTAKAMPRLDFDVFMSEIRSKIADRGYY
jgi:hypothetical protein